MITFYITVNHVEMKVQATTLTPIYQPVADHLRFSQCFRTESDVWTQSAEEMVWKHYRCQTQSCMRSQACLAQPQNNRGLSFQSKRVQRLNLRP